MGEDVVLNSPKIFREMCTLFKSDIAWFAGPGQFFFYCWQVIGVCPVDVRHVPMSASIQSVFRFFLRLWDAAWWPTNLRSTSDSAGSRRSAILGFSQASVQVLR